MIGSTVFNLFCKNPDKFICVFTFITFVSVLVFMIRNSKFNEKVIAQNAYSNLKSSNMHSNTTLQTSKHNRTYTERKEYKLN